MGWREGEKHSLREEGTRRREGKKINDGVERVRERNENQRKYEGNSMALSSIATWWCPFTTADLVWFLSLQNHVWEED